MGADTSATHMIFFITAVMIALSVTGALFLNIQSLSSAMTTGSKTLSAQLKTDIKIINDPEMIPKTGEVYTFYVKNIGKEDLFPAQTNVIIDGTLITEGNLAMTIVEGDVMWLSGDILKIDVTTSLISGSHNLRVITDNGVEDSFSFRV